MVAKGRSSSGSSSSSQQLRLSCRRSVPFIQKGDIDCNQSVVIHLSTPHERERKVIGGAKIPQHSLDLQAPEHRKHTAQCLWHEARVSSSSFSSSVVWCGVVRHQEPNRKARIEPRARREPKKIDKNNSLLIKNTFSHKHTSKERQGESTTTTPQHTQLFFHKHTALMLCKAKTGKHRQ